MVLLTDWVGSRHENIGACFKTSPNGRIKTGHSEPHYRDHHRAHGRDPNRGAEGGREEGQEN